MRWKNKSFPRKYAAVISTYLLNYFMKTSLFKTAALGLALVATGVNAYHSVPAIKSIIEAKNLKNAEAKVAIIDRLEYDFAKAAIRDNYYRDLDQLASTIVNEKYAISLRGHADSIGNYVANWKLSDKRAEDY